VESVRTGWTFERAGGVAGLLAAALMLASAAVGSSPDEANATDGRLLEFYGDSGNQYRLYVAALIAVLAGLLFLWFLVVLHDRLSRIDLTGIPSLVFAAGLVFVVLWLVSSAIGTALPASLVYSAELELTDMGSLRVLLILGNHWLAGAAASTAAFVVGGASLVARRHRLYARWLAWAGLVVALLMLPSMAAFAGFTVIGLILWTAAVGVWLARGRSVELTT
jgi:hypothetical protein